VYTVKTKGASNILSDTQGT